jgi:hemoglobin-like flavoprotein
MDKAILKTFGDSLQRCNANPAFLDRFYETFLASSPVVREKFANTDFARQKQALRASLRTMLLVAEDETAGPERHLGDLAHRHSRAQLDIGGELYDLWLDSLLATVKECDPAHSPEVAQAWESVMMLGVNYLISRYNPLPRQPLR